MEQEGLYSRCAVCQKRITEKDVEKGNGPFRIPNIPGFVHARCKAGFDIQMVGAPVATENLDRKLKDLIGG